MIQHPNYYADWFRGQVVYRCCVCSHDSFSLDNIQAHVQIHPPVIMHSPDLKVARENVNLAIGVITSQSDWPSRSVTLASWEATRLRDLGIKARVYWVDNGSDERHVEGNHKFIIAERGGLRTAFREDLGQSVARNLIITQCLENDIDYLLMVDGDIELINYSGFAMLNFLLMCEGAQARVGCIGMYSRNSTAHRDDLATQCLFIAHTDSKPGMAWTQYGMFDCAMFREGIRFDTSQVFKGRGWGFEDDDLYCQMLSKGYTSRNTKYFRYAHYAMHSSLASMEPTLAAKVWLKRKLYVYNKWVGNPKTHTHVEKMINQSIPVV